MSDRKVHGLLFTPENVERLLREAESPGNGKSQTRRVATPHNSLSGSLPLKQLDWSRAFHTTGFSGSGILKAPSLLGSNDDTWHRIWPRVSVGDLIWVREGWGFNPDFPGRDSSICFRADPGYRYDGIKWKSPLHLKRRCSRLTLEVTAVRSQRLQDISPDDAKAEGDHERSGMPDYAEHGPRCHVHWYRNLWDRINGWMGAKSWNANPLVWAYTFRVHAENVESVLGRLPPIVQPSE